MLAAVPTFTLEGVDSREVTVEVDVRPGLPTFSLVGLPDRAVRESRERVRAALLNSGLDFPQQRLTVNLAPAHLRKVGPGFDLAIAVALLGASRQVPAEALRGCAICGELALSGELRPVRGALAVALGVRRSRLRRLLMPALSAPEAAIMEEVEVIGVPDLARLADFLHGRWDPGRATPAPPRPRPRAPDLADVRGQSDARRALEIAAAGSHNLLMVGPPGVGKTMLARRLPGILPPPEFEEALEITRVRGVAGAGDGGLAQERPFRAPHHTISAQGLVGGGSVPRPGEVTLAHGGVLFLDELGEFSRPALDALRQPLEEGSVEIMRGQRVLRFPAEVSLIVACNRCPCGRGRDDCSCTAGELARYLRRLSGPLLDRLDLVCHVGRVPLEELVEPGAARGESSAVVRERVVAARKRQLIRLRGTGKVCNGHMDAALTRRLIQLTPPLAARLITHPGSESLSGRGHDRVLRVARTIADLAGRDAIEADDLDEALGYRVAGESVMAA